MSNTFTAPFAQTPKTASAVTTAAAVVASDAPTNTALLFTADINGAIMTRARAMPRATVTAASVDLFLSNDGGTTKRLFDSELMAAYTFAASTAKPDTQFQNYSEQSPFRLGAGDQVYCGSEVALAAGIVFVAEYTNF